ncbi:DUF4194 domain-containing protein [Actinomyces sp.]|uniref:DUF4194 domain-containing protein n=1 Tax=Actinomyces sp. TaxID=29317 RepID=UPI0026DAD659|nr:DUF4194 domain-containing protein [Actinomyces sp.]MDO4899212.1 DUF4194 domain-containing protein [Actinomyces sp.]
MTTFPDAADAPATAYAAAPDTSIPDVPATAADQSADALWPGDTGTLPAEVRAVLVRLVQGPYVSQTTAPNLWAALVAHERIIRSRLADLFLDLAVDLDEEIAFARNADTDGAGPGLMRKVTLSFADTALLLHLRHLLLRAAAAGERAYVGLEEMVDNLSQYRDPGDTDLALVARRARAAVKRMVDYKILTPLEADDRYEIMPILALIVTSDVVAGLEAEYRAARGDNSEDVEDLAEVEEPGAPEAVVGADAEKRLPDA